MAEQGRYQEAHTTKLVSDALEEEERTNMNCSLGKSLAHRERNLRKQHRAEMDVLLKRVDSKRREYLTQRNEDSAKLLQRNKNIQASIDSKHVSTSVPFAKIQLISCFESCCS